MIGSWIGGREVSGAEGIEVRDPGRPNDVVGVVTEGGVEHIDRAVEAATGANAVWGAMPLEERAHALDDGIRRVEQLVPELAPTLVRENGALLREAELDFVRSIELSRDMIRRGLDHLRDEVIESDTDVISILRQPIGVMGAVVPWNSPMVLAASKVAPALVAGNTVVLKPSPAAPIALTLAMTELSRALPDGALNIVNSAGASGPALSSHIGVRKFSFTGSTQVGREVMAAAAGRIKRISLELGGNDAAIVLDDVDLTATIDSLARGIFTRAGQVCFGVKRVYVARSRYAEFVEALSETVDRYVVGYGMDPTSDYGPLISAQQSHRLLSFVDDARASGATVRELGRIDTAAAARGGYYLRPTIVTGIAQSEALVQEEQFGPAIPVLPFDDIDHAVALANDSEYGLASSVWSSDVDAARAVAARIEAGVSFINAHNIWSLSFDMPFGGVKQSGLGRERTALGLDEYVETHAIRSTK